MDRLPLYQPFYGASEDSRLLEQRAREAESAGLIKRAELSGRSAAEQLLSEFQEDAQRLSDPELRNIYGPELTEANRIAQRDRNIRERQAGRARGADELAKDIPLSILSGGVNLVGGLGLLGLEASIEANELSAPGGAAALRESLLDPGTRLLGDFNRWRQDAASDVKRADAAIMGEENLAAAARSEERYVEDLRAADNPVEAIIAGGARVSRDFGHDAANILGHTTTLADSVVEQVPTLAVGAAAKGLISAEQIGARASALALQREAQGLSALAPNALREVAETQLATRNLMGIVSATEAGAAYGQEASAIWEADFEDLRARFPEIAEAVDRYGPENVPGEIQDQLRSQLASRVGVRSAAMVAPLAAIIGRLGSGIQLNPLGKASNIGSRVANQARDIAGEITEEALQGATSELAGNFARQEAGDITADPLENVGGSAGVGAATAGAFSGALRAPSITADAGITSGKMLIDAVARRGAASRGRIAAEAQETRDKAHTDLQSAATQMSEALAASQPESAAAAPIETDPIVNQEILSTIRGDYTGPLTKMETLSRGLQALDKIEMSDQQASQISLVLLKIAREVNQEAKNVPNEDLREGMLRLANHDYIRTLEENVGAMKPEVLQQLFDQLPTDAIPAEAEMDPDTRQVFEQVKELAFAAPDRLSSEQVGKVLAQRKRLKPEEVKQFELALDVAQAREQHAAQASQIEQQFPKNKTPSAVQFEIQEGGFEGKLSLADYVRRISQAMSAGNTNAAKIALKNLQNFSAHMRARSESFDQTAAKQRAEGKDDFYEVPIGGTIGKDGKLDRTSKFRLNINKPGSLATMQFVFADANAVARTYNSLAKAYPELLGAEEHPTNLAPTFESVKAPAPVSVQETVSEPAPQVVEEAPAPEPEPEPTPAAEKLTLEERQERNRVRNEQAKTEPQILKDSGRGFLREEKSTLSYDISPEGVKLNRITTPREFRGKGTARKLITEFLRQVDERDLPSTLTVDEQDSATTQEGLIRFYESVGYVQDGFTDQGSPRMTRPSVSQRAAAEQAAQAQEDVASATTMVERFPGLTEQLGDQNAELTPQKKYQRTNKFLTGFKLAAKSRALFARMAGKLNQLGEALVESARDPRALLKLLVPEHQFMQPSQAQADALRELFGDHLQQVVDNLNSRLAERMFKKSTPTSETLFDELTKIDEAEQKFSQRQQKRIAEAKAKGKPINTSEYLAKWLNPERLSMHVLEWGEENGEPFIRYQPEVAEAMALAALNWVINNVNNPVPKVDLLELQDLYGVIPTQEIIEAHEQGYAIPAPVRTIAQDITNLLGVIPDSNMSVTYTDGMPKALAMDVLQALVSTGAIEINTVKNPNSENEFSELRFVNISQDDAPGTLKNLTNRLGGRTLLQRLLLPDTQELPTFGTPSNVVPVFATGTRQRLSEKQRSAIKKANKIKFHANIPLINTLDQLGRGNYLSLLGYYDGDLGELNVDHARTVRGVNQGLDYAIDSLIEIYQLWQNKAEESGKTMADIPAYFSRRIISNGRMMMNGFGPQGDKIARETISAIRQKLDLRGNQRHQLAYYLTLAQALGIKTENVKNARAAEQIRTELEAQPYQDLFSNLQQLSQMQEGEERDALSNSITEQMRQLAMGNPGNRAIGTRNGVLTSRAIHALVTHARYLAAVEAGTENDFETYLAFELDGLTDGPINAIEHFGFWSVDPLHAFEQVARGGHFINVRGGTTRSDVAKELPDLYATIATSVGDAINFKLTQTPEKDRWKLKPLVASIELLTRIGHVVSEETPNGTRMQVVRAHAKSALMTMIYGAGKGSVVRVLASEIMTYVNQELSNSLKSGVPLDPMLQGSLAILMGRYRNRDGKWVDTPPLQLNNLKRYKSGLFDELHIRALVDNLASTSGGMLTDAVEAEMDNVLSTFQLLYTSSAFQSWSYQKNYDTAYEAKRQQRIQEGKLSPKDALSREDEDEIKKELAAQIPAYALSMTGDNTVQEGINVIEKDYNGEVIIDGKPQTAGSLFGGLRTSINAARVSYPGVRAAALLTIALGDASMMTDLQNNNPDETLDVYDGWEVGPVQLADRALEVNKVVHENWQFDGLGSVVHALSGMQLNIDALSREELLDLADYVRLENRDEMDADQLPAALKALLEGTRSSLERRAEGTRINKKILQNIPQSTDHMSGGENPALVEGEYQEDLLAYFDAQRLEQTAPAAEEAPQVRVMNRQQLLDMVAKNGFTSPIHKFVFDKIAHILPENLAIYIGTELQMKDKQRELFPDTAFEPEATAWYFNDTLFLANNSQESLIHELVHAATYRLLLRFYDHNGRGLSFFQKEGIRALDVLAHEFTQLDLSEYDPVLRDDIAHAQKVVRDYLTSGDTAAGVNEFMAWALANENIHLALSQTQGSKFLGGLRSLAKRIRNIVRKLLNLPQNQVMETFLEQALGQFERVARRSASPIVTPSMPLNQALGQAAPAGAHGMRMQQLADDFEYMRMHLPRDGRNEAQVLLAGADALIQADKIRQAFVDAGFVFTQQEQYAFEQLQALFASTVQLDPGTLTSLQNIYNQVMPQLSVTDFLEDPLDDSDQAMEEAKNRFDALKGVGTLHTDKMGRSNDLANFVALALVNEPLRKKLGGMPVPRSKIQGENLDQRIRSAATAAFDWMSSTATLANKALNQQQAIDTLVARLNRNQRAAVARANMGPSHFAGVENAVRSSVGKLGEKAKARQDARVSMKQTQGLDGWINRALASVHFTLTEEGASAFAEGAISWLNEAQIPTVLQQLGAELVGLTESNYPIAQMLNQVKHTVARVRQRLRDEAPDQVRDLFSRALTPENWASLHRLVGRTDLQALFGKFTADQIRDMLLDPAQLQAAISALEVQLGTGPEVGIWTQAAQDLGHFLMTGENQARVFLWRNPEAMAQMAGMGSQITQETVSRVTPLLDQLTTLRALERTTAPERAFLSGLLETEKDGMEGLLRLMRRLNLAEFRKPDYQKQALNRWKGHIPASLDPRDDLVLATPAQGKKLLEQGYRLVGAYQGDTLDPGSLSYYAVTWSGGQATYNQGAMQTVEGSVGGVDRLSGRTLQPFTRTMITASNTVDTITTAKTTHGSTGTHNLLPVFNNEGNVVAYERLMDRSLMEQHLTDHLDLAKSIGMWMGRQAEEEIARGVNEQVTKVLKKIWDEGKLAHRESEFLDISSSSATQAIKEAWSAIPRETQDQLRETYGRGPIMVRKDMINNALGYRSASVANVFTGLTDLPKPVQDTIINVAFGLMGIVGKEKDTYRYLLTAERAWQSLVATAKDVIVVRSGIVALSNGIANQFQLLQMGVPINRLLQSQVGKIRETEIYLRNEKRIAQLQFAKNAAKNQAELNRLADEQRVLQDANSRLSIWPLIEAGELPSIAEGLTEQDEYTIMKDFTGWLEKKFRDVPEGLTTAAKYALITKDTALYLGLNRAIQFGDFMAKAVSYDLFLSQGMSQEQALRKVNETFVNYNLLPGRSRDYLESMGLTWFLNYKLRIAKIVLRTLRENPLRFLMAGVGADWLGADSLVNSSPLETNWGYAMGPGQFFRAHDMLMWNQLVD